MLYYLWVRYLPGGPVPLWPWLRPPEADREAQVQGTHVMPVLSRNEEGVSWGQNAGQEGGLGELGELL